MEKKKSRRVDPTETPDQKFVRLATRRVNNIFRTLRLVSNLARYPHTPEQAQKIVDGLRGRVELVVADFQEKSLDVEKEGFSL